MKPYRSLTRFGQIRRLRELAVESLCYYGLEGAKLTFLHYQGNVVFRVDTQKTIISEGDSEVFLPGRYLLRVLTISDEPMIQSEMIWLSALRSEGWLAVPEPVSTLEGNLLVKVYTPGVPRGRVVTLMRWVDGRHLSKGIRPRHAKGIGETMANLHNFSADWDPPEGFLRYEWDWNGLFGEACLQEPIEELLKLMPAQYREPFLTVSNQVKDVMQSLGKAKDGFGLIHADMYMENILFKEGQPRVIDFEDCGYGYWLFDIGVVLSQWWGSDNWKAMRDAFLDGYTQSRALPYDQKKHVALFTASVYATSVLWSTSMMKHNPALTEDYERWREEDGLKLITYHQRMAL